MSIRVKYDTWYDLPVKSIEIGQKVCLDAYRNPREFYIITKIEKVKDKNPSKWVLDLNPTTLTREERKQQAWGGYIILNSPAITILE